MGKKSDNGERKYKRTTQDMFANVKTMVIEESYGIDSICEDLRYQTEIYDVPFKIEFTYEGDTVCTYTGEWKNGYCITDDGGHKATCEKLQDAGTLLFKAMREKRLEAWVNENCLGIASNCSVVSNEPECGCAASFAAYEVGTILGMELEKPCGLCSGENGGDE